MNYKKLTVHVKHNNNLNSFTFSLQVSYIHRELCQESLKCKRNQELHHVEKYVFKMCIKQARKLNMVE